MHSGYEKTLRWALDHSKLMLGLTIATLAINIFLFKVIPKGFFPEQDTGRIAGNIQASQDISFQSMRQKLATVVDIIRKDPDVTYVIAFTGGGSSTTNTGRMFIALKPFEQRTASASEVIARLRKKLARVAGAPTFLQPVQDLRIGGKISNALYQYTLQGESYVELNKWAPVVVQKLRTLPQLVDVSSDQQDRGLQASLVIDRDTASRLGITPKMIDSTLYGAFGQSQVSITYTLLNQYHVVMEVAPQYWQNPDTLKDIYVASPAGTMVPLSAFTHYEPAATSLAVNHQGQFPSVTASFNLAPGVALGDAVKAVEAATGQHGVACEHQKQLLRHCAGLPGLGRERTASDPCGPDNGLHRPGHIVRKLHTSDYDPFNTSLGRGRRGACAAGLSG